jgi:hypothetical protein
MEKNNIVLYGNDVQRSLEYLALNKGFQYIDQKDIYTLGIQEMYKDVFEKTEIKYHKSLIEDLVNKHLPLHLEQNISVGADTVLYSLDKQLFEGKNVIINPFNQFDMDRYKQKGIYVVNTEGIDYNPQFQLVNQDYTIDHSMDLKKQWDIFFQIVN